ncbi:DUF427 domain-containing protein [Undibacterium sp. RTI2.1]|uniref:DUF427 domain-containing protein n=1 Tax=unclassified Undibacterium TaxID=2630295 RepID=UPI002B23A0A3|nr:MULTISPECIES: DUF427 domain-containing protein [unclassified Undibacterium]MEB0032800.1 DUF427 domain-containing protein [Undibacterium sp. RTI2.1]MEB0118539.1 DUF427 domain-containing protein [Undibacterium sp. RTI2.2]
MPKAIWNGAIIAQATDEEVEIVESNIYFPPNKVNAEYLKNSAHHTVCGWKGTADYYSLEVDGKINENAAWLYRTPKDAAKQIAGFIAFWKGVQVTS